MKRSPFPIIGTILATALALVCTSCAVFQLSGPKPIGPLRGEFYHTGWIEGDCAYHAVTAASDGNVYFTVSSHVPQQSAHLYRFSPSAREVRLLWEAGQTLPNDGSVTQGKIHSPVAEQGDDLLVATHTSWYSRSHTNPATGLEQKPYPGGSVFAVNRQTGKGRVIAQPLSGVATVAVSGKEEIPMLGEGLIASAFDSRNNAMYLSSWPGAIFARVDTKSGKASVYGARQAKAETVPDTHPQYQRALRTLTLDPAGNVYGCTRSGSIWRFNPTQMDIVEMRANMSTATAIPLPEKQKHLNMWRTIVWDDRDRAFYGVHWATSWLFKFDPVRDIVEPIMPWRPQHMLAAPEATDVAQLGLALGPDHVLYGLVHAPAMKKGIKRNVHLIACDLNARTFKDYGYLLDDKNMALMFAESCTVAPNGDVYTVGWVEVDPGMAKDIVKRRKLGAPTETRSEAYLMSLVRIPTANLRRTTDARPPQSTKSLPSR